MKVALVIPVLTDRVEGVGNLSKDVVIFTTRNDSSLKGAEIRVLEPPKDPSYTFGGSFESRFNYSYYTASKEGFDLVVTVSGNVVEIPENFIEDYLKVFCENSITQVRSAPKSKWYNVLNNSEFFSRGFPLELRVNYSWKEFPTSGQPDIVCHMGLWRGDLDLNAVDHLSESCPREVPELANTLVGQHFPLSIANVAVRRDLLVALFQIPTYFKTGSNTFLRGWGDVWSGYILQRLASIRNQHTSVGYPIVTRKIPVVLSKQIQSELYGYVISRYFCKWVDQSSDVAPESYPAMYNKLSKNLLDSTSRVPYFCRQLFTNMARAMLNWSKLFLE